MPDSHCMIHLFHRCQQTTPICQPNPCENNGQCVSLDNIRYRCNCASGFDGQNCQNNIGENCAFSSLLIFVLTAQHFWCKDLVNQLAFI